MTPEVLALPPAPPPGAAGPADETPESEIEDYAEYTTTADLENIFTRPNRVTDGNDATRNRDGESADGPDWLAQ